MSDIKVTGTPMTYGDGATRNTKEGKGRFDLIPPEPMEIIDTLITKQLVCIGMNKHSLMNLPKASCLR